MLIHFGNILISDPNIIINQEENKKLVENWKISAGDNILENLYAYTGISINIL